MREIIIFLILLFSTSVYSQDEDFELIDDLHSSIRKMDLVVLEVITKFLEFNSETGALVIHKSDLEQVTELIKKINPSKIIIQVHTAIKGKTDENYRISVIAAQNLKNNFSINKISEHKIEAVGMGESEPLKIKVSEQDDLIYNKRVKLILQFHTY